jgi:RHS repeat-associated protein
MEDQGGRERLLAKRRASRRTQVGAFLATAVLTLILPSAAPATVLPSTISEDLTLTAAGNTYTGGAIKVEPGVMLKAEPGVQLVIGSLEVLGTLKAEGTAEAPVIFKPETTGGTWNGIVFKAGSGASVLDHVEVKRAGYSSSDYAIKTEDSSPTITNSTIRESPGWSIYTVGESAPEIADNFITGGRAVQFSSSTGETLGIDFHDNLVEKQWGSAAVFVEPSAGPVVATSLGGNVIANSTGNQAIYYNGGSNNREVPPDISSNTAFGNTWLPSGNQVAFSGVLNKSATWEPTISSLHLEGTLTVAGSSTLQLDPGLVLHGGSMKVQGALKAEGNGSKPVVFEPRTSSSKCGSIKLEAGSGGSVLDHMEIYGCNAGTGLGAIEVKGSSPRITNSTIRASGPYAIKVTESGAPKIEWNRFRGNSSGLSYSGTGRLAVRNNDWGCASGPEPAGCGASVTSNVEWKPAIQLPEQDGPCRGDESQCGEGADPVSLATGALSYSHRDLLLTNKSEMPLEFVRSYSSGSAADTGLGPGWSQTGLASATELASGAVLILRQDGRQDLFYKTGEETYKAPSGATSTLTKVEGAFQLSTLENTIYRFDASGRVASITDDHGLKTTYGYDANGRLATITDPSAQTLTFSYNGSNHITAVKDSTGREAKYTYSSAGDLKTVTDALGGLTEYTYDSAHRLKTIKDPRGNVILKNTYDGQGRVIEQRDALENLWTLEYKEDETVVTDPEGGKKTYGFDAQNRVISEKDQLGHTTTTSYDEAGNVHEIVKPGGAKWTFGHDAGGNLTSVIDPEEGERTYEYDGLNHLTSFTDERRETWSYEWDGDNDLAKITDPAEGETTFTHDAAGLPLTVTDPNEHTTTFTYDARGNRLSAKDALEHTTAFGYNARNQLISKTGPGLKGETYGRNALGDLLSVTTPEGNKTEYAHDGNGMLTQVTDPAGKFWKIERNEMERPTSIVDPLEHRTEIDYDGNLNPIAVTDRRGKETTYAYDLANQLTEVVRPEGGDWEFDYDARGNRVEVVEPRENTTTYEYDLLDRMAESAEPLGSVTSYEYDPAGNLTAFTDPLENTTGFAYDELGRVAEIEQPLEKTASFTYDGVGNRLTQSTAAGTLEYAYDAADRLESISTGETTLRSFEYDPAGHPSGAVDAQGDEIEVGYDDDGHVLAIDDGRGQAVSREYDSRGNVIEQTDGRGTLEYGYDPLSRMTSLVDPQSKEATFAYDAEGNLTEVALPNGAITTNSYDDAGRIGKTSTKAGEVLLQSFEYDYDAFGNRISQIDHLSQETTYAYDALGRLTQFNPPGEGSTTYGYDAAGNRIEAAGIVFSFNALNQLTNTSTGTTYDYDDAGRLAEVNHGEQATTYEWSPLDELVAVDDEAQEILYTYDALGRQTTREDGSAIRLSHYGDLSDIPILDIDAEGGSTMSYVQGPKGLIEQRSAEATSFPLPDAHGDITAIADEAGEVVSRQTYDPWGSQLSGPSLKMGWLGTQQRRSDPATGLIQMGVRPYSPELSAFAAEDPVLGHVGRGITMNRYPYAWDDPVNLYDLDGRDVCLPTPLGDACAEDVGEELQETTQELEEGLETAKEGLETAGASTGSAADAVWDSTAPGRSWVSDRATTFWKNYGGPLESIYKFAGAHWQECREGGKAGAPGGAVVGAFFGLEGIPPGAAVGAGVGCVGAAGTAALLEQ